MFPGQCSPRDFALLHFSTLLVALIRPVYVYGSPISNGSSTTAAPAPTKAAAFKSTAVYTDDGTLYTSTFYDCAKTACITTTWALTKGTTLMINVLNGGGFDTELSLTGPTTLTRIEPATDAENSVWTDTRYPTTFPTTITIGSGNTDYLEDISFNTVTAVGPTTITTTVVNSGEYQYFVNSIDTDTEFFTQTVLEGTQTIEVPSGKGHYPLTLTGPTTYRGTYTEVAYFATEESTGVLAGGSSNGTQCQTETAVNTADPNRIITYAYQYVSLDYGQTTVADSPLGLQTETNNGITATFIAYSPSFTWTGPTVVSITTTQDLLDYGQANIPGLRCGAVCGNCALVFPTVSVLYFPTASPDTACLSTLTQGNHSFTGFGKRGVTSLEGSGSTLVNDEGFTFTSPSVYVVFPTISATDSCGKVGSVHTSTTLAFAPGKLSTAALGKSGLVYSSFDFKYVSCPPSDGNTLLYSIIGQTGYNPIISASSIGLQNIDNDWDTCDVGDFQGNDPPFALKPADNADPGITPPAAISTPAPGPSSPIAALPAQTSMFNPQPMPPPSTAPKPADPVNTGVPASVDPGTNLPVSVSADPGDDPSASADPGSSVAAAPSASPDTPPPVNSQPANTQPSNIPPANTQPANPQPVNNQPENNPPANNPPANNQPANNQPANNQPANNQPANNQPANNQPANNPPANNPPANNPPANNPPANNPPANNPPANNQPANPPSQGQPPSPSVVVINGVSSQLQAPSPGTAGVNPTPASNTPAPPALQLGTQVITADPSSNFVLGSQTIVPGGPPITVSGTPVSIGPGASIAVVAGSTQNIAPAVPANTETGGGAVAGQSINVNSASNIILGPGQTYTANSAGAYSIGSQTLTPGGPAITVSGSTLSIPAPATTAATEAAITFGGSTFALNSASNLVIGSQTVAPGQVVTISGTAVSLAANPTDVVVGTSTQGLASLIVNGFNNGGNASATSLGVPFDGSSSGTTRYVARSWKSLFKWTGAWVFGAMGAWAFL